MERIRISKRCERCGAELWYRDNFVLGSVETNWGVTSLTATSEDGIAAVPPESDFCIKCGARNEFYEECLAAVERLNNYAPNDGRFFDMLASMMSMILDDKSMNMNENGKSLTVRNIVAELTNSYTNS